MRDNNSFYIKDVCNFLLKQYPLRLQEKWDYSGFVNKPKKNYKISKMCICLDINKKIIDKAIKNDIKLIISHHPIFIDKNNLLSCQKYFINQIKKYHITVLSLHTCFDNSRNGMNFLIANALQLRNIKWFDNKKKFIVGNFSRFLTISEIVKIFKKQFSSNFCLFNRNNEKFKTLAICAGAGMSNFTYAFNKLKNKHILLVTGDVKYHSWQNLNYYKLACLDVGHGIENCFVDYVANLLKTSFINLNIYSIKTQIYEHVII